MKNATMVNELTKRITTLASTKPGEVINFVNDHKELRQFLPRWFVSENIISLIEGYPIPNEWGSWEELWIPKDSDSTSPIEVFIKQNDYYHFVRTIRYVESNPTVLKRLYDLAVKKSSDFAWFVLQKDNRRLKEVITNYPHIMRMVFNNEDLRYEIINDFKLMMMLLNTKPENIKILDSVRFSNTYNKVDFPPQEMMKEWVKNEIILGKKYYLIPYLPTPHVYFSKYSIADILNKFGEEVPEESDLDCFLELFFSEDYRDKFYYVYEDEELMEDIILNSPNCMDYIGEIESVSKYLNKFIKDMFKEDSLVSDDNIYYFFHLIREGFHRQSNETKNIILSVVKTWGIQTLVKFFKGNPLTGYIPRSVQIDLYKTDKDFLKLIDIKNLPDEDRFDIYSDLLNQIENPQ